MLIERLRLKRLLSFRDTTIELGQLNVLIGPNGVGKSNLIETIGLLQALPTSLRTAILRGGGIRSWLWMGDELPVTAEIECDVHLDSGRHPGPLQYGLSICGQETGYDIVGEQMSTRDGAVRYFGRALGNANIFDRGLELNPISMELIPTESLLMQYKTPADPTPITALGQAFSEIRIFREFRTGFGTAVRNGISTNSPKDVLLDGAENLAMVLDDMDFHDLDVKIVEYLKRLSGRYRDVKVQVRDGLARIFLSEDGLKYKIPSARMSDGTLKFLALLAALFHRSPPALMCIEDPELGLHPDAIQIVAEALIEASERTQLIVTTHSEELVSALSHRPESVTVCERDFDGGTEMKRLDGGQLESWLERYTLGELWRKGEIGGGRW